MRPSRRAAIALALALAAGAAPARAQGRDTLGLRPAFRLIDRFVAREMQRSGTPGLALALVDRRGLITIRTYGYADLERRQPVEAATRFEIGSISKSFTAIALLQLMDEGRFDPNQPVRRYLPWFTPVSRFRPITGHDLLTHTAGLPRDRDDIPSSLAQAYLVRERAVGSAPGTHWAYSNIGFQVLGALLEKLDSAPYPDIIRRRILDPLGLTGAAAAFTNSTRLELARGYVSRYDDRPSRPDDPLVPAPWIEYASGDGALVMTAPELARYLVMLLNRGAGPRGRVLSEAAFARLTQPYVVTSRGGDRYGYGLFLGSLDGRPVFHHSGGMLGYSSFMIGEPGLGIGAVAMVNGPGDPGDAGVFALRALGAAMRGDTLPELPTADPALVADAARYAGSYTGPAGATLQLEASGDTLFLMSGGRRSLLVPQGGNAFLAPADSFPLFLLRFAGDSQGMTEAWYGGAWYTSPRYSGPRSFPMPAEWSAFPGHYRIMQPWEPDFRVVARKGKLWYVTPDGDEEPLTPLAPREFRVGGEQSAERLRFDDLVDGKALSATLSGMRYYRFFTP
jgi:CubicO group peptidase (beta-lactamase class C family)